jgi:hypothetical protein
MLKNMFLIFSLILLAAPMTFAQEPASLEQDYQTFPIKASGVEIYPQPDRASGRLFAVIGDFAPFVGGISEDGDWLLIYFYERGELTQGWSPAKQFDLPTEFLADLPVLDPDHLPDLPDLAFDPLAVRPVGVSVNASDESVTTEIIEGYNCVALGGDQFQWDVVEVTYEAGIPVKAEVLQAAVTGGWRLGCPGGEQTQTTTTSDNTSNNGNNQGGDNSGGGPPDDGHGGGGE